ncbi:hypothetical protein D3C78_1690060 [compost metagenome]
MAQRGGGVDQAAVEKDEAFRRRLLPVFQRHGDRPAGESLDVDPGQGGAVIAGFFDDDAPTGLLDGGETAPGKLCEEGGFAAAGAAGKDDETVHGCFSCVGFRLIER